MYTFLLIGIGGFIGAILRYIIVQSSLILHLSFPIGTLSVNFIGSFILGLVMFSGNGEVLTNESKSFLVVGLLGSFTTMSAFSYESFKLFEQKEILLSIFYIVATVGLTLFAVLLGKTIKEVII